MTSLIKCFNEHKSALEKKVSEEDLSSIKQHVKDYKKTNADKSLIQKNLSITVSDDMISDAEREIAEIFDSVRKQGWKPKEEVETTEPSIDVEKPEKRTVIGRAWIRNGWKPIQSQEETKKGRVKVTLLDKTPSGKYKTRTVEKSAVRLRGKTEPVTTIDSDTALPYNNKKESTNALYMAKKRRPSKSKGLRSEGQKLRNLFEKYGHKGAKTIRIASSEFKDRKAVKNLARRAFKTKVVFFKTSDPKIDQINGVVFPDNPDTIYVNSSSTDPLFNLVGHETMHVLQHNHPDLYEKLEDVLLGEQVGFDDYLRRTQADRGTGNLFSVDVEGAYREFYADFLGDQVSNTDFWRKLYNKDATLTEKIINIVQAIIDRLVGAPRRFVSEDYFKDLNKAQDVLADVVKEFRKRQETGLTEAQKSGTAYSVTQKGGKADIPTVSPKKDVQYSIRSVERDLQKDTLSTLETIKAFIEKPKLTIKGKTDLSAFDLIASIPNFFKEKIPAVKSMFNATQERQDEYYNNVFYMENHDDVNTVASLKNLPKKDKERVQKYLVENDRDRFGYRVVKFKKEGKFELRDPKGAVVETYKVDDPSSNDSWNHAEQRALADAITKESNDLRRKGFSEPQIRSIVAFRMSTNKGFDMLMQAMEDLIQKYKAAKMDIPKITTIEDGKAVQISLEKAMAMMGDMRGYYFPRIRPRGKYILTARKGEDDSYLETFDYKRRMMVRQRQLEKQDYTVSTRPSEQLGEDVFDMAGNLIKTQQIVNAALDRTDQQLKDLSKEDLDDILKKTEQIFATALAEQVTNVIRERGSRAHMTRRSDDYYKGYEEDPEIAIAKYIRSLSGGEAKRDMVVKLLKAFTGTEKSWQEYKSENKDATFDDYRNHVKEMMIDQRKQKNAFKWGKAYIGEVTRNREFADEVIGTIKGVAVAKYLAFRVFSAPLVNLTALATSVPASMKGAGIPFKSTPRLLSSAIKDYANYLRGKPLDADSKWAFGQIKQNGWDNPQFNSEALSVLRSKMGRGWDKILNAGMWTFGESERLNRIATITGAYKGLRKLNPDASKSDLLNKAKQISDDSHGIYNRGNYPYLALGGNPAAQVVRMFYVFRTFSHTYMMNMKKLGWEEKNVPALTYMLVSPAVIAGAGASILAPIINEILKAVGFDDPEEDAYLKIGEMFGPKMENVARFGLAGAAGFSIKGSLKIGVGDIPTSMSDLLGAPGSVFTDLKDAFTYASKGDVSKGFERGLPTGFGNVLKAIREGTEGLTTRRNAPIFHENEPVKLSLVESFYRGMSLYPARIAKIRESQWKTKQIESKYKEIRTDINSKIRKYWLSDRSKEDWAEILGEIQAFNEDAASRGLSPITSKSIKTMLKRGFTPEKLISKWVSRYLESRASGESVSKLRKEVQDYNRKERSQGRPGVAWSRIVDMARKRKRLQQTDKHRLRAFG